MFSSLQRITARYAKRRALQERVFARGLGGVALLQLMLSRHTSYLLWIASLSIFELAEVWILWERHHTYLLGPALLVLRVVAVLRFIPLGVLLAARVVPRPRQVSFSTFIFGLAKTCLVAYTLIALGAMLWVVLGTNFHVVASPYARAILMAGLVALPLEAVAPLLLFNLSRLSTRPLNSRLRSRTYLCFLAALVCLWFALPVGYFLLRLLGSVVLIWGLSRAVGFEPFAPSLHWRSLLNVAGADQIIAVAKAAAPIVLLYVAWEASFLVWSSVFVSSAMLSLLFFILHKVAHLAGALSFRLVLSSLRPLCVAMMTGLREEQRRLVHVVRAGALWSVVCAGLLMVPLAIAKQQMLTDHLPLSEGEIGTSALLIACALIFLFAFSFGFAHIYLLSAISNRLRHIGAWIVGCAVWGSIAYVVARDAARFENAENTIEVVLLSSALLYLVFAVLAANAVRSGRRDASSELPVSPQFLPLSKFLSETQERPDCQVLILESAHRIREEDADELLQLDAALNYTILFGRQILILLPRRFCESSPHFSQLIARLASFAERWTIREMTHGCPKAQIEAMIARALPCGEIVSRGEGPSGATLSAVELDSSLEQLRNEPGVLNATYVDTRISRNARAPGGWILPIMNAVEDGAQNEEVARMFRRMLFHYERFQDPLHVACRRGSLGAQFLVDIQAGILSWVPPQYRTHATALQGALVLREVQAI